MLASRAIIESTDAVTVNNSGATQGFARVVGNDLVA